MCFIFKFVSMTVDLFQRIWAFLMTCCITGTVCILFAIVSISGVAFGYHYSITEFLTYKDSQASVIFTRDIDGDSWWPEIPNEMKNSKLSSTLPRVVNEPNYKKNWLPEGQMGIKNDYGGDNYLYRLASNKQADKIGLKVKTNEDTTFFSDSTGDVGLEEILKKYPSGSVGQMRAVLNHFNSKRTTTFQNFPEITRTTLKAVDLLPDYDEEELASWRKVAQNVQRDYPVEISHTLPRYKKANVVYEKSSRSPAHMNKGIPISRALNSTESSKNNTILGNIQKLTKLTNLTMIH